MLPAFPRFASHYLLTVAATITALTAEPVAWWSFNDLTAGTALDRAGNIHDSIDGRFTKVEGIKGNAIRFDSFTTEITRPAKSSPKLSGGFSIEANIALGAYPWNWCSLVTQRCFQESGYSLDIGTKGELRLQLAIGSRWQVCTTKPGAIPLREWKHIAATYDSQKGIKLYIDGKAVAALECAGEPTFMPDFDLRIGTNQTLGKPSNLHREYGTLQQFYSLDGIIDELKIHNQTLSEKQIASSHQANRAGAQPELPVRRLPSGPQGPGRFGAYYQKLKYYPEWDALWAVSDDPDIVVRFDESPARVVFWRGTRYSPAWVSGNDLWMADQSVEAWDEKEGCFEHMQDRRCRHSHVRIIESNDARAVVHWRYAPTSAHQNLWREDPKTARACWVDEYYTIYPDTAGVRNVSWVKGTLGHPQQFQESLPLTHPGQYPRDVVKVNWVEVANYAGETGELRYEDSPKGRVRTDLPENLTIQRYNFKSEQKPFICFEPGNRMKYLINRPLRRYQGPGSCNHWPVGQAICDGRTSQAADRPTHFCGFPVSDPPKHLIGDRYHWYGFYGMTEDSMDQLVRLGRSWAHAAKLELSGKGLSGGDYDRGQRAYQLEKTGEASSTLTLKGSTDSPIINPAFVVKGWGESGVDIRLDGTPLKPGPDCRIGKSAKLDRTDLILWLKLDRKDHVQLELSPAP